MLFIKMIYLCLYPVCYSMQKFFPFDKNYILKEAQASLRNELLCSLVDKVKKSYLSFCNPLGLEDDTVLKIKGSVKYETRLLEDFYNYLAGIYRYKFSSNQLEFLFDGNSHFNKYSKYWEAVFQEWIDDLTSNPNFLKAILEISILFPKNRKAQLAEVRLKTYISQYFELKVYKYRGIIPMKVA